MNNKNRLTIVLLASILLFMLSGCSTDEKPKSDDDGKLMVYTTVYPLADFTEKIGGTFVETKSIYPPGVDEHTYEPSQQDIIKMANGNLFFYIGYNLEGFVQNAESILADEGVKVVAVGEHVEIDEHMNEEMEEHGHHEDNHHHEGNGHHHGPVDPHIWLDPLYAKQMARIITNELSEAMPEQKDYFENNFLKIENELQSIHEEFEDITRTAKVKEFVVSHAAYGYWEKRYGITQLNISGISTAQEPSQKQLIKIIDKINEKQLKYILVEQNVSNHLVEVLQEETNTEVLPLHNLAVLTEEDLDKDEDYFSLMKRNSDTLKKALNP